MTAQQWENNIKGFISSCSLERGDTSMGAWLKMLHAPLAAHLGVTVWKVGSAEAFLRQLPPGY